MWRDIITSSELEFLAENSLITITPNFRGEKIKTISGRFGPFKPNREVSVPLWLAFQMKKNKKCRIRIPSFLEENNLKIVIEYEKNNKNSFYHLVPFFYEISNMLFNKAEDDFFDIKKISGLVQDISTLRNEKILFLLKNIKDDLLTLQLNELNDREIELIRPLLKEIFPFRLNIFLQQYRTPNENILFVQENNEE